MKIASVSVYLSFFLITSIGCNVTAQKDKLSSPHEKKEEKVVTSMVEPCNDSLGINLPSNCSDVTVEQPFEGLKNFREFTPPVNSTVSIKEGMIYRSDAFGQISKNDVQQLSALGIRTIIDLRSKEEVEDDPNKEIPGVQRLYNFPIGTNPDKLKKLGLDKDIAVKIKNYFLSGEFDKIEEILKKNNIDIEEQREIRYREFVTLHNTSISNSLKLLADSSNYPVVFHCQGGKDRTGFLAAVIQKIAGFSTTNIYRDYLTTNMYTYSSLQKRYLKGPKALRPIYGAHKKHLKASLKTIDRNFGNFDNYLKEALYLTDEEIANIRKNLLKTL